MTYIIQLSPTSPSKTVNIIIILNIHLRTSFCHVKNILQLQCCLQLLRLGARVNAINHDGLTALMIATQKELEEMVKILLK